MHTGIHKILVTGGAGFIGSAFVRLILRDSSLRRGFSLTVVDKLTYAGDLVRLKELKGKYNFYKADICNNLRLEKIFKKERPQVIVNFSAETHVDRSIQDATAFVETNIKGVQTLLDLARKHKVERFIQISSDEVYGEIRNGKFSENSPLRPNSPYAASKAAADLLIKAYTRTYNFPAIIIRPSNNYGPWQYPEKLIPLAILKILRNEKVPVYGKGRNIREWLYVEDCAEGVLHILKKGKIGEIYNLGSNEEKENIETVKMILENITDRKDLIEFVKDRPGHDIRYSLDSQKAYKDIGWQPKVKFRNGIRLTVQWYLANQNWLFSKYSEIAKLYKYQK